MSAALAIPLPAVEFEEREVEWTMELEGNGWRAGPSWCTHVGVTRLRGERSTCLRCGSTCSGS